MNLTSTGHSITRASQRGISDTNIAFVLQYGRRIHNGGAVFYFLGRKDIPEELRPVDRIAKLEGITIILSHDGSLLTTYKNRSAIKDIKKKLKRYLRKE